jgi:hypothetical protein
VGEGEEGVARYGATGGWVDAGAPETKALLEPGVVVIGAEQSRAGGVGFMYAWRWRARERRFWFRALFTFKNFYKIGIVVFSFIFDKYC